MTVIWQPHYSGAAILWVLMMLSPKLYDFIIFSFDTDGQISQQHIIHKAGRTLREHLRQILAYLCLHGFSGPFSQKQQVWGQNMGTGGVTVTPNELFLTFWGCYLCAALGKIDQQMRQWECTQTDRYMHRETKTDYNLSRDICYSYGTDNKISITIFNMSLLSCSWIQTWNLLPVSIQTWYFFCSLQPQRQHYCN